jgi:hypothetical protein
VNALVDEGANVSPASRALRDARTEINKHRRMEKQVEDIWKFGLECHACEPTVPAKGGACVKCNQKVIGSKRTSNADTENSKQKLEDKERRIHNVVSHFTDLTTMLMKVLIKHC